jgi:hypothetical protein
MRKVPTKNFTIYMEVQSDPGSSNITAPPTVNKNTLSKCNVSAHGFPVSFVTATCGPTPGMSATWTAPHMDARFNTHTSCTEFGKHTDIAMTASQQELADINKWVDAKYLPDFEHPKASGAIVLEAWCMHPVETHSNEKPPMRIGKTAREIASVLTECAESPDNTTVFKFLNTNFADKSLAAEMLSITVHIPYAKKHLQYLKAMQADGRVGDARATLFDSSAVLAAARTETLNKLVHLPALPTPGDECRVAVEEMLDSCILPAPECVQLSRYDDPIPNDIMTLTLDNLQSTPMQYTCGPVALRFVAEAVSCCNLGPTTLHSILITVETEPTDQNGKAFQQLTAIAVAAMSMQMRSENLAEYNSDLAPIGIDSMGAMVHTVAEDISGPATLAIDINGSGQVCLRNDCEGLTHHGVHYIMQAILKSSLEIKALKKQKNAKMQSYLSAAGIEDAPDADLALRTVEAIATAVNNEWIAIKPQLIVAGAPAATAESLTGNDLKAADHIMHEQIFKARSGALHLPEGCLAQRRRKLLSIKGSSGGHCCGLQIIGDKVYPAEFTAPVQWVHPDARAYCSFFPEKSPLPVPTVNFAMAVLQGLPHIEGTKSRSEMIQVMPVEGHSSDFYQRSSVSGDCIVASFENQNENETQNAHVMLGRDINQMQGKDTVFIRNSSDLMQRAQELAKQRGRVINTYTTPIQSFQGLVDSFPKLQHVCTPHSGSSDDGEFISISTVYTTLKNTTTSRDNLNLCLERLAQVATKQYSGAVFRVQNRLDGVAFQVCMPVTHASK